MPLTDRVNMSKVQMLRSVVTQRLTAAAQEIFGLFERTISEYEEELSASKEENERQRRLLDAVFNPEVRIHRADVQQLLVVNEEQQEWSSSLDQKDLKPQHIKEDSEPPHIKEEQEDPEPPHIEDDQEELWTSQEGEQLQGLEEAGIKFTPVMSEDDEEAAQSSQLPQRQTEQMETEADGEDCEGPEPDRESGGDKASQSLKKHVIIHTKDKPFNCSVCDKSFKIKSLLKRHMSTHTGEKPFRCSVCKKDFARNGHLKIHMLTHTGEKPFSCSECKTSFAQRAHLKIHMSVHTGEKPFSCSVCKTCFAHRGDLQRHMLTHTGEKPFSCLVCKKSFIQSGQVKTHMLTHTGEKPFSCSVCEESFTLRSSVHKHMRRRHTGEKLALYTVDTATGSNLLQTD